MTVRELAVAVAKAHGLDLSDKGAFDKLMANTLASLSQPRVGVVRESVDGVYRFRAESLL